MLCILLLQPLPGKKTDPSFHVSEVWWYLEVFKHYQRPIKFQGKNQVVLFFIFISNDAVVHLPKILFKVTKHERLRIVL